jgi:hypothetical protein
MTILRWNDLTARLAAKTAGRIHDEVYSASLLYTSTLFWLMSFRSSASLEVVSTFSIFRALVLRRRADTRKFNDGVSTVFTSGKRRFGLADLYGVAAREDAEDKTVKAGRSCMDNAEHRRLSGDGNLYSGRRRTHTHSVGFGEGGAGLVRRSAR